MKRVYICSPLRGDYENNIERAKEYSRAAAMMGCIPITPHLVFTQFLDDDNPAERDLALEMGRELVLKCDELWAFGLEHPSAGMAAEIETARDSGIPVRDGFEAAHLKDPNGKAEEETNLGSVTIHLPEADITIDGDAFLYIADRLRANPDTDIEIGGGHNDEPIRRS